MPPILIPEHYYEKRYKCQLATSVLYFSPSHKNPYCIKYLKGVAKWFGGGLILYIFQLDTVGIVD
jgi:hypothetical protein